MENALFLCVMAIISHVFYDQFLWTMQNSGNVYWHQSVINPPNDHQERRVYILVYTLIVHTTLFLLRTSLQYEILFRIRNSAHADIAPHVSVMSPLNTCAFKYLSHECKYICIWVWGWECEWEYKSVSIPVWECVNVSESMWWVVYTLYKHHCTNCILVQT